SSDFTCWLTAAWLTPSSVAARVKLSLRAAASKALRAFRGGRRRGIGKTLNESRKDTAGYGWRTTAPSPQLMRKSWITPRNDALQAGTVKDYFEPHVAHRRRSGSQRSRPTHSSPSPSAAFTL